MQSATMEDTKSYTVRTETGEIHLMSQEEVSTLVRATMARARNSSRHHHKMSRDTNPSSPSGDMNRRFSLASRYSAGKVKGGNHSEEISTSNIKQPLGSPTIDMSMTSSSIQSEWKQSRRLNTRRVAKESTRHIGSTDERFASLVRTVGPIAMDRDFDPETVSFTVSTEVDGQKHLSEQELSDLVRNSIVRARSKAQQKRTLRRSAEHKKSRFNTTVLSDDSLSPRKSLNRKFSWSTVEKSDDECDDNRDDETVERGDGNERCEVEPLMLRPEEVENVTSRCEVRPNERTEANETHELEDVFSTPCTSPKKTATLSPAPTSLDHRSLRGYETPSLSLVLSTGGDSVLSDRIIYQMVRQSMNKAKQTRQEISDLLEDTPSGVSKVDVADIVEGTMRRARETARSLEIPSLSPQKQRPDQTESIPVTTIVADLPDEKESVPMVSGIEVIEGKSISIDEPLNAAVDIHLDMAPDSPLDDTVPLPQSVEADISSTSFGQSATFGQTEVEEDGNQLSLGDEENEVQEEPILIVPSASEEVLQMGAMLISPPVTEKAITVHQGSCFDSFCCVVLALNPTETQDESINTTETQPQSPKLEENLAIHTDGEIHEQSNDVATSLSIIAKESDDDLRAVSSAFEIASSTADLLLQMLKEESANATSEVTSKPFESVADSSFTPEEVSNLESMNNEHSVAGEYESCHDKQNPSEDQTTDEATNEFIEVTRTETLENAPVDETPDSSNMDEQPESPIESEQEHHNEFDLSKVAPESVTPSPRSDIDEQKAPMDTSKARRKFRRHQNRSKYWRQRQGEDEVVITDEFLAEVNSMRGLKITTSELAKIFQNKNASLSPPVGSHYNNESRVHDADDSVASNIQSEYESVAQVDANKSYVQSPAFCADFLSIFSDPFDADDDFGSVSLYNNESAVETLSKKDSRRGRASRSIKRNPTPKSAEYESELANSFHGRRLTFSFSEGRYTVSMSLSDDY